MTPGYSGSMATQAPALTVADVEQAQRRIAGSIRATPQLPSGALSRRLGVAATLKAECLQRAGSFKVRGAFNVLAQLPPAELRAGVVTASAGNHGQAVSVAGAELGASVDVFMPARAPLAKLAAVRAYGGRVHPVQGSYDEAAAAAEEFATTRGATIVHPFDDPRVIAGQGTIGLEIARDAPATRLVVVPLGGGALAAGIAIAVKARMSDVRVVGVQAERCAPYVESLAAHRPIGARSAETICDGIAVKRPGELTLPLVERYVDEVVTVSDDQAAEAMVLLLERAKLVVEGAGAVGVAALMADRIELPAEGEVCAVLSGGNVDAARLAECIHLGETAAGRRAVVSVVVPDRPGALAGLLRIVAEAGANVIDVTHLREGLDLHVGETVVTLVLQTDGPEHSAKVIAAIEAEGFALG